MTSGRQHQRTASQLESVESPLRPPPDMGESDRIVLFRSLMPDPERTEAAGVHSYVDAPVRYPSLNEALQPGADMWTHDPRQPMSYTLPYWAYVTLSSVNFFPQDVEKLAVLSLTGGATVWIYAVWHAQRDPASGLYFTAGGQVLGEHVYKSRLSA